mgnify:CR=1 FL=1
MSIEPIRRQSLISLGNLVGLTVIGYIATMYFAHVLGPAILGSYYLFLSYYAIFSLIGDGGFGGAVTKRISEGKEPDEYFSAFIVLRIILLTVTLTALFILIPWLQDFSASGLFPWLVIALIAGTIAGIAYAGVYGLAQVGVVQISELLNTIVKIIVQIIVTILGYTAAGLAGGFIAGIITGFIINFHYLSLKLVKFGKEHLKSLLSFSFWIFLTSSGFTIFATADTILIGYFLSNADVGIYRIAYQLTGVALFVATALTTALYPRMSRWHSEGDISSISSALTRAFSFSLIIAIPVVIGGIILGDKLLYYLYGADFEAGTSALMILLLVQIATIFVTIQITCLNSIDQPKSSFIATVLSASSNIVLNIILIPLIGIAGAALATLISVSMNAVLSYLFLSRKLHVSLEWISLRNIIIAGGVMAIALFSFRLVTGIISVTYLVTAVAIGAIIYFLILFNLDVKLRKEAGDLMRSVGLL